jgi:hypothetical protein
VLSRHLKCVTQLERQFDVGATISNGSTCVRFMSAIRKRARGLKHAILSEFCLNTAYRRHMRSVL